MNEGALPELPGGWAWTRLENCIEILDSQRIPINADEREKRIAGKTTSELYPYYGATGQVGLIDNYLFDEELILLGEDGAPFFEQAKNKAYIIKGKSWVNNHAHVLKAIKGVTLNHFLCYYLNIFDYHGYVTGTTRAKLNQSPMRKIPIPLPPLPEQRRIVAKLEELFTKLDAGVDALKKTQAQLKRYRQSVLKAACEGKLVPNEAELARAEGRNYEPAEVLLARILKERLEKSSKGAKYKEPEATDTNGLSELPDGWVWANVGQMTDSMKNGIYKPSEFYTEDGIACLRMYNIDQGKIIWKDIKRMNLTKEEVDEFLLVPGDLLVNRVNSRELVGKAAVIPLGIEKCVFESKNIRVRVIDKIVNPHYLCYRFAAAGSEYFNKNAQQVVGMASISQPQIARFSVPLPPLAEQCRIVLEVERRLSVADDVARTVEQSLAQAQRLRQSILKKAFEGKLVEQNPNDEPAIVFLERIKEEKARRESQEREKNKVKAKPKNKKVDIMKKDTEELEKIIGLYEILQSSKKSLTPKELWQSSKLSIDDFYSQLKIEVEKGRIMERRPNDSSVFLEIGR